MVSEGDADAAASRQQASPTSADAGASCTAVADVSAAAGAADALLADFGALRHVLLALDGRGAARAACACRALRDAVARDAGLWEGLLERDFGADADAMGLGAARNAGGGEQGCGEQPAARALARAYAALERLRSARWRTVAPAPACAAEAAALGAPPAALNAPACCVLGREMLVFGGNEAHGPGGGGEGVEGAAALSDRLYALDISRIHLGEAAWIADACITYEGRFPAHEGDEDAGGGDAAGGAATTAAPPLHRVQEADQEIERWDGHNGTLAGAGPRGRWGATLTAVSASEAVLVGGFGPGFTCHDVWRLRRVGRGAYAWARVRVLQRHEGVARLGQRRAFHAAAALPGRRLLISGGLALGADKDSGHSLCVLNLAKPLPQFEGLELDDADEASRSGDGIRGGDSNAEDGVATICAGLAGTNVGSGGSTHGGALSSKDLRRVPAAGVPDAHEVYRGGHALAVAPRRGASEAAWKLDALVLGGCVRLTTSFDECYAQHALSYELRGTQHEGTQSLGRLAAEEEWDSDDDDAYDYDDEYDYDVDGDADDAPTARAKDGDENADQPYELGTWRAMPTMLRDVSSVVDEDARIRASAIARAPPPTARLLIGGSALCVGESGLDRRCMVSATIGRRMLIWGGSVGPHHQGGGARCDPAKVTCVEIDAATRKSRSAGIFEVNAPGAPALREGAGHAWDARSGTLLVTGGAPVASECEFIEVHALRPEALWDLV